MAKDLIINKFVAVQVMAKTITWANVDLDLYRFFVVIGMQRV